MIACKYCIAKHGLWGSDFKSLDGDRKVAFDAEDEFYDHLEEEHDLIVRRENETLEEAEKRVHAKNKRIGTESYQCPQCRAVKG